MDQQRFKFTDNELPSHNVKLDKERRESLVELMGHIVIHIFKSQKEQTDEHAHEDQQD